MALDIFYLILILLVAFVPAVFVVLYTKQSNKRGCGRGCERCGNRDFCHRRSLNMGKAAEKADGADGS